MPFRSSITLSPPINNTDHTCKPPANTSRVQRPFARLYTVCLTPISALIRPLQRTDLTLPCWRRVGTLWAPTVRRRLAQPRRKRHYMAASATGAGRGEQQFARGGAGFSAFRPRPSAGQFVGRGDNNHTVAAGKRRQDALPMAGARRTASSIGAPDLGSFGGGCVGLRNGVWVLRLSSPHASRLQNKQSTKL